ncbi:MAG: GFA family protein [Alphaproteobacteria bacterium]|nr:GFA family protein [Alphaproteobacteria bacterium]
MSPSLSPQSANFWLEEGGDRRMRWKLGSCHCGAVRFKVLTADAIEAVECNCSICRKTGFLHLIVSKDRFRLLMGEDKLTNYGFNTGTAKHLFCSVCGVKSFYVPRSHPEGFSVNVRCLDEGAVKVAMVVPFDGEHWEEAKARIADAEAPR